MSYKDLVRGVAERSGVPQGTARGVLDALVQEIEEALEADRDVRLPRIGTLSPAWREPRTLRSPADGRKMLVGGRHVVRFRAASALRDRLAARSPQRWRDPAHQAAWRLAETLVGDLAAYHPDKVPGALPPHAPPDQVESTCAAAFGPAWDVAAAALRDRTAPETHGEAWLGLAARRRWAARPGGAA